MKSVTRMSCAVLIGILFILSACGSKPPASPTSDTDLAYTQIWQTVEAGKTQTASAASPTSEFSNTPKFTATERNTNTPLISPTSEGTQASATLAVTRTSPPSGSTDPVCDNATFVTDVTYEDNSVVPAGTSIIKTWRIKNLGPCTWDENYTLIYGWGGVGTNWAKNPISHFQEKVPPGDSIDLSIELDTPTEPGKYSATFRTQNAKGFNFGPTLTILIEVK
jgi:hypothetical protein